MRWVVRFKSNPQAQLRLFCFPYAGGSTLIFRRWAEALPASVEVCPVELPGRGSRLNETPFAHLMPLAQATVAALAPFLDRPFALFGHSLGATLAFEVARLLRDEQQRTPVHFIVSARRAPQIENPEPPIHDLPEAEFMDEVRSLNGTPQDVLEHPELMAMMLPLLRADFCVSETYVYQPGAPLDCPITVYGGLQDEHVLREHLEAWSEHTTKGFTLRMLKGDHFFINTEQPLLLHVLARDLHRIVSGLAVK